MSVWGAVDVHSCRALCTHIGTEIRLTHRSGLHPHPIFLTVTKHPNTIFLLCFAMWWNALLTYLIFLIDISLQTYGDFKDENGSHLCHVLSLTPTMNICYLLELRLFFSSSFLLKFCSKNTTTYRLRIRTTTCWVLYNGSNVYNVEANMLEMMPRKMEMKRIVLLYGDMTYKWRKIWLLHVLPACHQRSRICWLRHAAENDSRNDDRYHWSPSLKKTVKSLVCSGLQ